MISIKFFHVLGVVLVLEAGGGLGKSVARSSKNNRDPDEFLNTSELARSKGYPAEEHDVTTQDGYILTVHRLPNPNKPVVFLQHGLLDASSSFVINFKNQSLGFVLWDAGYDVWMGNMRGCLISPPTRVNFDF